MAEMTETTINPVRFMKNLAGEIKVLASGGRKPPGYVECFKNL
jgi:hypothetical protein